MRLYVFKSDAKGELRAFAGDMTGSKLPEKFRPWHAVGGVSAGAAPRHGLSREGIERAIEAQGFQLWRLKGKSKAG